MEQTFTFNGKNMGLDDVIKKLKDNIDYSIKGKSICRLSRTINHAISTIEKLDIKTEEKARLTDELTDYATINRFDKIKYKPLGASLYNALLALKNDSKAFLHCNKIADLKTLKMRGFVYTTFETIEIETPFGKVLKNFQVVRLSSYALEYVEELEKISKKYAEKQLKKLQILGVV